VVSKIATIICVVFIFYLFWMERKKTDRFSKALWLPTIWIVLAGSRYVSYWLQLGRQFGPGNLYSEGSPIDRMVFLIIIGIGMFMLSKRRIDWNKLLAGNKALWMYFLYCGLSFIWSDVPLLSLKRLIKEMGNIIMVLVILTEENPYGAVELILRRLSYLLIPLSVLFIKYYPYLGRDYWQGVPTFIGVTNQKNDLGQLCLITGIYFLWKFLIKQKNVFSFYEKENLIGYIFLAMILWLLYMANSATSIACFVGALILFLCSRMRFIKNKPSRILGLGVAACSLVLLLDVTINLKSEVIMMLGRNSNLTSRVPIWHELLQMVKNPILGFGYMSFWSGDRMRTIWEMTHSNIIQAHNGYLEQYLNLGIVGVAFIVIIMIVGLIKVRSHLYTDYPSAILRLCFIGTAVLYNYTEASFYGINNMWLIFLLGVIEIPNKKVAIDSYYIKSLLQLRHIYHNRDSQTANRY